MKTVKYLKSVYANTGDMGLAIECAATDRAHGKTTTQALGFIAHAMNHPNVIVYMSDHYGTRLTYGVQQADLHLCNVIVKIIDNLGLKGFTLDKHNCTLKYSILGDVEVSTKYTIIN